MTLPVADTVAALRAHVAEWRAAGQSVALVPTMGALHRGHLALVRRAREEADRTVVSIFVNPSQFAPTEDFAAYPRTFETDRAMLAEVGADLIYAPTAAEMYPQGFATSVLLGGPAQVGLEDATRPHFFGGVATVVTKLLTQCGPDAAIFGEKDFQQLRVVTQLARDLDLPVRILGEATVRDPDGLAMSSRNRYLSADERRTAAALPRVLGDCAACLRDGRDAAVCLAEGRDTLTRAGFVTDYLELRDAFTLEPTANPLRPRRLLVAARIGTTRLIDNRVV